MLVIIGKNGCPFCESAKQLMVFKNQKFNYFDINSNIGKKKYQKFIKDGLIPKTWKTVPVVLKKIPKLSKKSKSCKSSKTKKTKIKGNISFIGGFNELKKYVLKY